MTIDILYLASVAGAIVAIVSLAKLVVEPFSRAIKRNDTTMKSLEKAIDVLTFDLKNSQTDRENIHKVLDRHEHRIGVVEDDSIRNAERISTLYKRNGE